MRILVIALASGMASACAGSRPAASIPATIYGQTRLDSASGRSRSNLDVVSRAAGIIVLRSLILPPGVRELRFSASDGGMIWHPIPVLRLVEWPDSVAGELYLYWPRLRDSTGRELSAGWVGRARTGCRSVHQTDRWATCRIIPHGEISWQMIADSLSALSIWDLPPGHVAERRGSNRSDQDGLSAEVLVGAAYRHFMYYDLDRLRGDDVPRVRAAARLVASLFPS